MKENSKADIHKPRISYAEMRQRMRLILAPERSFYIVAIVYGVAVSVLTLAVPISVQALVNTVAFTGLVQPLIVLSAALFGLLAFSGLLTALQNYVTELFQRRFYARMGSEIAITLLNANSKELDKRNGIELVNRYFDVMTVQKSLTNLLIGGSAVVFQMLTGLLLLAFYHPYFLGFDILLLVLLGVVWGVYGKKGVETAIQESSAKYEMANWLEELARANQFFKKRSRKGEALRISDQKISDYVGDRKAHFKQLFSQTILLLAIYAFMSSFILGLGGYLVLNGQLTLGQLVAAELVATLILGGFAKSGKYLEFFYDLYAAMEKLSHFYEVPTESDDDKVHGDIAEVNFEFHKVVVNYRHHSFCFHYRFERGRKYLIHSEMYSNQIVFLLLSQKLMRPTRGKISLSQSSFGELSQWEIREHVYVVDRPVVIQGSILDNLTFGEKEFSMSDVRDALEVVYLSHLETDFDEGLATKLSSSGLPLWSSQLVRLEMARALINKPKILIVTEVFDQIEKKRRDSILKYLLESDMTLLLFSDKEGGGVFNKRLSFEKEDIRELPMGESNQNA